MHPTGEVAAASAAGGTTYTLFAHDFSLEDVKAASSGPVWYQLYLRRQLPKELSNEREMPDTLRWWSLLTRPSRECASERSRNGMKQLLGTSISKLPFVPQIMAHPRWLAGFLLDGGTPPLQNIVEPGKGPMPLVDVTAALAKAVVTWEDLRWLRQL